ncbi:MAG: hypothetical protein FJZ61_04035 [Chlamydiae bacterium]|nr:hypothetical protein [Chlamydiota bacterium]
MNPVTYCGNTFEIPNFKDPEMSFDIVYRALSGWHKTVEPLFKKEVSVIGSTMDDIRNATKQIEANAGSLSDKEVESYEAQTASFLSHLQKFKETQSHAHALIHAINDGTDFMKRPKIVEEDAITLQRLNPSIFKEVMQLQTTCNTYYVDLTKSQNSVRAFCEHFDRRIKELAVPLDIYMDTVRSRGQTGYASGVLKRLSYLIWKPLIPTKGSEAKVGDDRDEDVHLLEEGECCAIGLVSRTKDGAAPLPTETSESSGTKATSVIHEFSESSEDSKKKEGGAADNITPTRNKRKPTGRITD